MKIIALDDERPALRRLTTEIKNAVPDADIHEFSSAQDVLEWAGQNKCDIAFLDINGMDMNGIELARRLKLVNPLVNIIFCTGYSEYALDAFDVNASGYLMKPITAEKVTKAMEQLRHPLDSDEGEAAHNRMSAPQTGGGGGQRVRFRCFGNFEAFCDGKPIPFKYAKTRELLAYLYDRRGAMVGNGEIQAVLWEDEEHISYLKQIKKDMVDTLTEIDAMYILEKRRGGLGVDFDAIASDYRDWAEGKLEAINGYRGEYMAQYSWAEFTNAAINSDFMK